MKSFSRKVWKNGKHGKFYLHMYKNFETFIITYTPTQKYYFVLRELYEGRCNK